jgi:hypothetical protein
MEQLIQAVEVEVVVAVEQIYQVVPEDRESLF